MALYPSQNRELVGVHLTTASTGNPQELKTVIAELKQAVGKTHCDAYLIANYTTHHASTKLRRELGKIARSVWLCDVSAVSTTNTSADVDVKIQLQRGQPQCFVRLHAQFMTGAGGVGRVAKPAPLGGFAPGQPRSLLDKTDKDWMVVAFKRI